MKIMKWLILAGAGAVLISVVALLLIPEFVDLRAYKPELERLISDSTGRDITIGNDIELSLFPWAGFKISDLKLENSSGFTQKDLLTAESLELRVKVSPLLSGKVQVKKIILRNPCLFLERLEKGGANWETPKENKELRGSKTASVKEPPAFPLAALFVEEFDISGGSVIYMDRSKNTRIKIGKISIRLVDFSLGRPVKFNISAEAEGMPVEIAGSIGPAGEDLFAGAVPFDIKSKLGDSVDLVISGKMDNIAAAPSCKARVEIGEFSPARLFTDLGIKLPENLQGEAFKKVYLHMDASGSSNGISISGGRLRVDSTDIEFSASLRNLSEPDIDFDIKADSIDLDRYMPVKSSSDKGPAAQTVSAPAAKKEAVDFAGLRKVKIKGSLTADRIRVKNLEAGNISAMLSGSHGVFMLSPLKMDLYSGTAFLSASADFKGRIPKTGMSLRMRDVNAGDLLRYAARKNFMEGKLRAELEIGARGLEAEMIKKTLNGRGEFIFNDGTIRGVDLSGMVRNIQTAFLADGQTGIEPSTGFTSLRIPLSIRGGVADISGAGLESPILRVKARGTADLVNEKIDIRVEPLFIDVLNGSSKASKTPGVKIPILITGPFDSPKFMPDMEETIKNKLIEIIESPDKKSAETHIKDIFKSFIQ